MRKLPRATWIAIVVTGILTILASVMGNIGATALTWLSPMVALVFFVLISLSLIGVSLWQEKQKAASESSINARRYREIMMGRVQNTWITGFLENRLYYSYDEHLMPLPLHERVGSRFDLVLSNPLEPTQTVPAGTSITQVFDQTRGELLILGKPGAGKTTLLLELARDLLKRAQDNEAAPIPLVLMLSSWTPRKLPLEQWIAEELQAKYDIPSSIGKEWVKANQLLLLLDGLDEIAPSALRACIEAINAYYHQPHRSLVVCSRTKEFLEQPKRLALHTAVIVQPLSSERVDTYLDDLAKKGEDIRGLKNALHQSEALRTLAKTPLFLTVLILAYHGKPVQEVLALVKAAPTDQLHLLFHNYIEQSLQRKGTRIHEPEQQTKRWLSWLARQMTARNQSELYLQQFRPDWLPEKQRIFYRWSSGLVVGLVVGLVAGMAFGLFGGLIDGLVFGLLIWLVTGVVFPKTTKIESREAIWSWEILRFELVFGLVAGVVFGLVEGLLFGLSAGLGAGLAVGLIAGLNVRLAGALQYYTLRFWLWQARCTPAPWRYVAFLDDAVELLLLRKVGGGYIFRHRLLQDYFASLEVVPPHDLSFRPEAR